MDRLQFPAAGEGGRLRIAVTAILVATFLGFIAPPAAAQESLADQYDRLRAIRTQPGHVVGRVDLEMAALRLARERAGSTPDPLGLAMQYLFGVGLPRSPTKALSILEQGLASVDERGSYAFAMMLGDPHPLLQADRNRALAILSRLIRSGSLPLQGRESLEAAYVALVAFHSPSPTQAEWDDTCPILTRWHERGADLPRPRMPCATAGALALRMLVDGRFPARAGEADLLAEIVVNDSQRTASDAGTLLIALILHHSTGRRVLRDRTVALLLDEWRRLDKEAPALLDKVVEQLGPNVEWLPSEMREPPARRLIVRARNGEPQAMRALGLAYGGGVLVPRELDLARKWLVEAAGTGDAEHVFALARAVASGRAASDDPRAEALRLVRALSEANWERGRIAYAGLLVAADAGEQTRRYASGLLVTAAHAYLGRAITLDRRDIARRKLEVTIAAGFDTNDFVADVTDASDHPAFRDVPDEPERLDEDWRAAREAVALFRRASELGNAEAARWLGVFHSDGRWVGRDMAAAERFWRLAAQRGDGSASALLGTILTEDPANRRRFAEGLRLLEDSAKREEPVALLSLARLRLAGRGGTRDAAAAESLARRASELGRAEAAAVVGEALAPRDPDAAARWFRQGADQGSAEAMWRLGLALRDGRGTGQDDALAVTWLYRAAYRGEARAARPLGELIRAGRGFPADTALGEAWLTVTIE